MERILKYKNRANLYQFLIDEFGMKILYENYDSKHFGNFCIKLSYDDIIFSYINDRNFLDIHIENKMSPGESFPLSYLMNYIYNPHNLNSFEIQSNKGRIENLNEFIRRDFKTIQKFTDKDHYINTKNNIERLLKKQFLNKFPTAIRK